MSPDHWSKLTWDTVSAGGYDLFDPIGYLDRKRDRAYKQRVIVTPACVDVSSLNPAGPAVTCVDVPSLNPAGPAVTCVDVPSLNPAGPAVTCVDAPIV